jgi:hypothetical protein
VIFRERCRKSLLVISFSTKGECSSGFGGTPALQTVVKNLVSGAEGEAPGQGF